MIRRDYLIVGAGVGGASVCEGIREHDKKGTIMMVGNETVPPYRRPMLIKSCLGKSSPALEKFQHTDCAHLEKSKVDLRLETIVTQFNLERRIAVLGTGQAVEFRKACLATGSRARKPQVAGANLGNVFYLRSLRDVLALRETAETDHNMVVVGGGCIAAEIAAVLSAIPKANVSVIHRGKSIWNRTLDEETAAWLTAQFSAHGVKMLMGETLNGFEGRTALKNVQTKSGQRYPAGLAVVAIGVEMNLGLVANTPLSYPHGTPVSEYLETDEKGIFAVGDIAAYPDKILGGVRRVDHVECAIAQGHIAGANMTGKKRQKFEWVPHRSSTLFDLRFDFVGDFSRPAGRVEIEGDRAKKKFVVRHFHGTTLLGMVLCNQSAEKVEAAKGEVRCAPREMRKHVP